MTIEIRTAGYLRESIPAGATVQNVDTVGQALEQLGLPLENELILLVNDKPADWKTELRDGDTLSVLPGIAGGCESMQNPRTTRHGHSRFSGQRL